MSAGVVGGVGASGRRLTLVKDKAFALSLHLELGGTSYLVTKLTKVEARQLIELLEQGIAALGGAPTRSVEGR